MSKKQIPTELIKVEPVTLTLEDIKKDPTLYMVRELGLLQRRLGELTSMVEDIHTMVHRGPSADRFNGIQKTQRQKPLSKEPE